MSFFLQKSQILRLSEKMVKYLKKKAGFASACKYAKSQHASHLWKIGRAKLSRDGKAIRKCFQNLRCVHFNSCHNFQRDARGSRGWRVLQHFNKSFHGSREWGLNKKKETTQQTRGVPRNLSAKGCWRELLWERSQWVSGWSEKKELRRHQASAKRRK